MPNYKEIEQLLADLTPFKHAHSMSARIEGDTYRVLSYSTLIGEYSFATNQWNYFNDSKYSVTTSKQQNILRRVIAKG